MDNMNDNRNLEEQNNVEKSSSKDNATGNNVDNENKKTIAKWIGKFHLSSRKKILIVYFTIVVAYICILHFVPFDMNGFLDSTKDKNNYNENVDKPSDTDTKDNKNSNDVENKNEQDNNEEEDTSSTGLTIYKDDKSVFFTVPTESKDAEILDKVTDDTHGYVLYKDNNKIKLYSSNEDSVKVLNDVDSSYDGYSLIVDETYNESASSKKNIGEVNGIFIYNNSKFSNYVNDGSCKYYDIKQGKNRYDGYCVYSILQDTDFLVGYNNLKFDSSGYIDSFNIYLINKNEDKPFLKDDAKGFSGSFWIKDGFIGYNDSWIELHNVTLYSMDGEKLTASIPTDFIYIYQNKAYYYLNNELVVINNSGKIIHKKSVNDYKVAFVSRNYAFAIKDNKVIAINLDDFTEYNLANYDSSYGDVDLFEMLSGYVSSERSPYEVYGVGYYIYFKESRFSIYFNPDTKEIKNWNREI